jgi:hypothetical protein
MTNALRLVDTQPQTGAEILDDVTAFVSRFSVFPHKHCAPMLALWYAHTWAADHFYTTPRLILSSAEPESGKTRVLEVAQHFTKAPEMTMSGSAAALVRMVAAGPITILLDEVDTVFTAGGSGNEDIRGMLNGGYKRTNTIPKCKGDTATGITVERLPTFAPAALAGLVGCMPPTITTRAITVHLRKRRHDQHVESYKEKRVKRDAEPIRDALAAWITGIGEELGDAEPAMPPGVADRAEESWEPLLAIADAAGSHWPDTARQACMFFVQQARSQPISTGVQLLGDLRALFTQNNTDRMATTEILHALCTNEDSPWGEFNNGRPMDARRLSKELSRYHIRPTSFDSGGKTLKGYVTYPNTTQAGLADAWSRYLPPMTADNQGES